MTGKFDARLRKLRRVAVARAGVDRVLYARRTGEVRRLVI